MKPRCLRIFLLLLAPFSLCGQRTLEIVSDPMPVNFESVTVRGQAYFIQSRSSTRLSRYDGRSVTDFPFPNRDGVALAFGTVGTLPRIVGYHNDVYILLHGIAAFYLYRFNGASYSEIPLPGTVVSNLVIFQDRLHFAVSTSEGFKLFSYDGRSLREVAGSLMPATSETYLIAGDRHLYVHGCGYYASNPDYLKRYDGTSFLSIPFSGDSFYPIRQVVQTATGEGVYIRYEDGSIDFFNGTLLSTIYHTPGIRTTMLDNLWRGEMIFLIYDPDIPTQLFACAGTTIRNIAPPAGEQFIPTADITTYDDDLILPLRGSEDRLMRYNGTTFAPFFTFPEGAYVPIMLLRDGNLLVIPKPLNDGTAHEFDGATWTMIETPGGEGIYQNRPGMECFHIWSLAYFDEEVINYRWVVATESKKEPCVPAPPPGGIVPGDVSRFERLVIDSHAKEREWCWTDIDIDWIVNPLCPDPPCFDLLVTTTLIAADGKVAWQKTITKPSDLIISLHDDAPYTLSLALQKDKALSTVAVLDKNFVQEGLSTMSLDFHPLENYLYLTVDTDPGTSFNFVLSANDAQGKSLWLKEFKAPYAGKIVSDNEETCAYLSLTLPSQQIANVSYYPNPAESELFIENKEKGSPITVILSDLNGKEMHKLTAIPEGLSTLDISTLSRGLYIITLQTNAVSSRELLQLK